MYPNGKHRTEFAHPARIPLTTIVRKKISVYAPFLGIGVALLFSYWLMFHTFSYNTVKHEFHIAFKLWSDFGAHIPMIRSFSMGDNLTRFSQGTVEYPIFPGEPIRYHFLFYMLVGVLERIGVPIDWALNIPSIAGFFALLLLLYIFARELTGSRTTGIITVLFFLFNGTLGFLQFFDKHPLGPQTLSDILRVKEFPAFAPWGKGEITAFWNLNIYTNQRHLGAAFAIILGLLYTIITQRVLPVKKQILYGALWGAIIGIFPFFHQPALLIAAVFLSLYFFLYPKKRLYIFTIGIVSASLIIPQLLASKSSSAGIQWYPGYTIHNELFAQKHLGVKLWHMATYWFQNMGLHMFFIPAGLIIAPKRLRIALLSLLPLFLIPNLFKFSVEASANHKFFNFVMILGNIASAYTLVSFVKEFQKLKMRMLRYTILFLIVPVLFLVLTLSGIIDFMVVVNDKKGTLPDYHNNDVAVWIAKNTPPGTVFLNSQYLYHPASLVGRRIFLGWPYFPWSAGYKENRMPVMDIMYESSDWDKKCQLFQKYAISYITVEDVIRDTNLPEIRPSDYAEKFKAEYTAKNKRMAIYAVQTLCPPQGD